METNALLQDIATVSRISSLPVILQAVSELTGMRVSLVARVTHDSWTACAVSDRMEFGLAVGDHLDVATTLCKEVHDNRQAIVIEQASTDATYCNHRTPKLYNIESYIALPIYRTDGSVFGTLCAIDAAPAQLPPKVVSSLGLFAELISRQLTVEEKLEQTENLLASEQATAQLREQFIAVLGHDLRSPLSGIMCASKLLLDMDTDVERLELAKIAYDSSKHMAGMIEDILDFSRGRLGGGFDLGEKNLINVSEVVTTVVEELKIKKPMRSVRIESSISVAALLEPVRFRQLVTNLLSNALENSPEDGVVQVSIEQVGQNLRLRFRNGGDPIPSDFLGKLFEPFSRGASSSSRGLGLGLFICSEIVRAHDGSIHVESNESGTVFTVLLPI